MLLGFRDPFVLLLISSTLLLSLMPPALHSISPAINAHCQCRKQGRQMEASSKWRINEILMDFGDRSSAGSPRSCPQAWSRL